MHRSRYYRNSATHQSGTEYHPRFPSSHARSTYKTTSVTPYSPSQMKMKELKSSQNYSNPRFVDRSKYVWTANKQPAPPTPQTTANQTTANPVQSAPSAPLIQPKRCSNPRDPHELSVLTVNALDSPMAVVKDIALNLREKKTYLIRKVVDVVGVKKAIKLYYDTRTKESKGGILTQNGKRRRTPGGVFLSLLRETSYITPEEAEKVFDEIKKFESQTAATAHYYTGGGWN